MKLDTEQQNMFIGALFVSFIVLAIGQYILFRNVQHIKTMTAEGLMMLKEQIRKDVKTIDEVVMKDGRMMILEKGVLMPMDRDIILESGVKIMRDGSIVGRDGGGRMMKEGQRMNMRGEMMEK